MIYFDSSALVKRVREEAESTALEKWIVDQDAKVGICSSLVRVEVVRAVAADGAEAVERARRMFNELSLVQLTYGLLDAAANLAAPLRSLDAVHLASALRLGSSLRAFVAYDRRLLAAAEQVGLPVASPGLVCRPSG